MAIIDYRNRENLTQRELASRLEVDQTAISNWERGLARPCKKYRKKLCELFRCSEDELLAPPNGENTMSCKHALPDMYELCSGAVKTFGAESQTMIAIEEMAELTKELCKFSRGRMNQYNIAEEIADVQIMLEQMIILYDCREEVEEWKLAKLLRINELLHGSAAPK